MRKESFGVVRLGKDSIPAIKEIDSHNTLSLQDIEITLSCSQVPNDLSAGSIVFIWLGSDNSKGVETSWEKGLRAMGVINDKRGGPAYKDEWTLFIRIKLILPRSLSHRDYIHFGKTYEAFSDIPVLGLNTYSNQLAQLIAQSERKDVRALLYAISSLVPNFSQECLLVFPELLLYLDYTPDVASIEEATNGLEDIDQDSFDEIKYLGKLELNQGNYDPYPIDSIFVRSEPRTVFEVLRRINGNSYIMNPLFQRDFLWDEEKQSKFIESVIMRIPLPPFYLSERMDGKVVVVDGLQRLTTFQRFADGKLVLQGLTGFGNKYNGKLFGDLPETLRGRIEDAPLTLYLIDAKVTERARLDIFERVNSGVPLTRQQMRNALYNGVATEFLRNAVDFPIFALATGRSLMTDRIKKQMRDREIINRFCSFLLLGPDEYLGDLDTFLGAGLDSMNKSGNAGVEALSARFSRAMKNNFAVFSRHAFRKHTSQNQSRSVLNVALFEVMSVALADADEEIVVDKASAIREAFYRLMENSNFREAISLGTADISRVRARFSIGLTEIGGALND